MNKNTISDPPAKRRHPALASVLLLLIIFSVCSSCAAPEYAVISEGNTSADGLVYSLYENGSALITGSAVVEGGILYIPSEVDGHRVTGIASNAFEGRTDFYALIISGGGCRTVGQFAFASCRTLTYASISGVKELGDSCFSDSVNLTECSGTDSLSVIGDSSFSGCISLCEITLPASLKTIKSNAFSGCVSLSSVVLPSSLKEFGSYVFFDCSSLAYAGVTALKSIPAGTFAKCTSLVRADMGKITSIGEQAFRSCSSLESVFLPKSLKKIENDAFGACSSLSEVGYSGSAKSFSSIDTTDGNDVCLSASLTAGASAPKPLDLSRKRKTSDYTPASFVQADPTEYESGDFLYVLDSDGRAQLTSYTGTSYSVSIPESIDGHEVVSIGDYVFINNPILISVDLGNRITSVGESAFYSCTSLSEVKNGSKIRTVGIEAFGNTPWIESFSHREFVVMFDSVLLKYNGSSNGIIVPDGVSSVAGGLLIEKPGTVFVYLPESVECLGPQAFSFCDSLRFVWGPSVREAGDSCFSFCTSLPGIRMPSLTFYGKDLLSDCHSLRHADLGDNIAEMKGEIFYNDQNLRIVCVGASVGMIHAEIFDSCMTLIMLYDGTSGDFAASCVEDGDNYLSDMILISKKDWGIAGK